MVKVKKSIKEKNTQFKLKKSEREKERITEKIK
jgi:hypothetical protein